MILIIRIISVIESFFVSVIVFKILAENCEQRHFSLFKGNNSKKDSSDIFDLMQTFVGFILRIISAIDKIWLNLTFFWDIWEKLLTDPFVLYIVTVAMFFDEQNISDDDGGR